MRPLILLLLSSSAFAKGNADKGREIYMANCVGCHGVQGNGQGPAARAIQGTKPRDFTQGKFSYGSKDEEIFKTLTEGVKGSAMPNWSSLSEDERWDVIAYIRKLEKK